MWDGMGVTMASTLHIFCRDAETGNTDVPDWRVLQEIPPLQDSLPIGGMPRGLPVASWRYVGILNCGCWCNCSPVWDASLIPQGLHSQISKTHPFNPVLSIFIHFVIELGWISCLQALGHLGYAPARQVPPTEMMEQARVAQDATGPHIEVLLFLNIFIVLKFRHILPPLSCKICSLSGDLQKETREKNAWKSLAWQGLQWRPLSTKGRESFEVLEDLNFEVPQKWRETWPGGDVNGNRNY